MINVSVGAAVPESGIRKIFPVARWLPRLTAVFTGEAKSNNYAGGATHEQESVSLMSRRSAKVRSTAYKPTKSNFERKSFQEAPSGTASLIPFNDSISTIAPTPHMGMLR